MVSILGERPSALNVAGPYRNVPEPCVPHLRGLVDQNALGVGVRLLAGVLVEGRVPRGECGVECRVLEPGPVRRARGQQLLVQRWLWVNEIGGEHDNLIVPREEIGRRASGYVDIDL